MSKSYFSVLIVTLFVSLIIAGCGDYQRFSLSDSMPLNTKEKEHNKDGDIQILSLELTPSITRLAVGTTTDFNLTAIFSNGSSKDITRDANWSSSKPEVLNINAGSAQALKVGSVMVTASYLDINVQKTIAISPSFKLSGASTFDTNTGELISNGNKLYVPDSWDKEEHILLLGNFTIDAGSTLNVSGNNSFEIDACGDICIEGQISFRGRDGNSGANRNGEIEAEDGSDGAEGGIIVFQSDGDLSITTGAKIDVNGGKGGDGGEHSGLGQIVNELVTGGTGGNGGNAGIVYLSADGAINVASNSIIQNGGDGGKGGNISTAINNDQQVAGNGGNGGKSYDGTGGAGGDGGDILSKDNNGIIISDKGGNGGSSKNGQGGAGGKGGLLRVPHNKENATCIGGNGGDGGKSYDSTGGVGGKGGGVLCAGNSYIVISGKGGSGGSSKNGQGGAGGNGANVLCEENKTNATITTGDGGSGGNGYRLGGDGGDGGGIRLTANSGELNFGAGGAGGLPDGRNGSPGVILP